MLGFDYEDSLLNPCAPDLPRSRVGPKVKLNQGGTSKIDGSYSFQLDFSSIGLASAAPVPGQHPQKK